MHTCRDWPIMLIISPIMLCCTAHKIYLLCSKLCSRITIIVLSLLSLFVTGFEKSRLPRTIINL